MWQFCSLEIDIIAEFGMAREKWKSEVYRMLCG